MQEMLSDAKGEYEAMKGLAGTRIAFGFIQIIPELVIVAISIAILVMISMTDWELAEYLAWGLLAFYPVPIIFVMINLLLSFILWGIPDSFNDKVPYLTSFFQNSDNFHDKN